MLENFQEKNYLSEYIEAELPQAFKSRDNKSIDTYSSIPLGSIDVELVENSVFAIPDIPIMRVYSLRGKINVTNRYGYNLNKQSSKHHRPSQAGLMPLPGLVITEIMRTHLQG